MDSLNKSFVQLSDVVKSMTPAGRITAAASLGLVAASLIWLANQRDPEPEVLLMGGQSFSATQLRDMQSAFGKAGLSDHRVEGDRVFVPRGQQSTYMAALDDEGALPKDFGEYSRQAVNSSSFMLPGSQQEAKAKIALENDLRLAVSRMKGVKNAWVTIAEQKRRGFRTTDTVTASVVVEPLGEATIDEATMADIRSVVAGAWGGLKPDAVTVVEMSPHRGSRQTELPGDTRAENSRALLWLAQNWKPLGTGGLILVGLFVLRASVRSVPQRGATDETPAGHSCKPLLLVNSDPAAPAGAAADHPAPAVGPPRSLREELIVMIREHPHAAAGVLRTWIGNPNQ